MIQTLLPAKQWKTVITFLLKRTIHVFFAGAPSAAMQNLSDLCRQALATVQYELAGFLC